MYPKVYKEIAPHRHLRQYIKCYWMFEKKFAPGQFERVYPDSSYELIHMQAGTYSVSKKTLPKLFMVGQLNKPVDFMANGQVKFWAVRFYPWGLRPFGNPSLLQDKSWVAADRVLGKQEISVLQTQAKGVRGTALRQVLDAYFLDKLLAWQFPDASIGRISRKLLTEKGRLQVQELADHCYLSRRQLERKIIRATGKTPKEIAGRLRFERTRDALMHNPDVPLSHLAAEYGYNDQAHLTREFKRYTDITPSAYADMFRRLRPQMQNKANVVFLQDDHPTDQ